MWRVYQNPDLDSELIRLCIRVLEKSDYPRIGLIVSNRIAYSSRTNGFVMGGGPISYQNFDLDLKLVRTDFKVLVKIGDNSSEKNLKSQGRK